jgi:hypothetical protein
VDRGEPRGIEVTHTSDRPFWAAHLMPPQNIVLYKYYPPERVDVLERRIIYFAHPSVFNDPFELQPYFRNTWAESIQQAIGAGTAPSPFVQENITLRMTMTPQLQQQLLADRHKQTLIFSTSQDGVSLLLWGHYAAGHTGFAVGFKSGEPSFHQRLDGTSRKLQRVNYSSQRPAADTVDQLREQEMLLTKSSDWLYEKEWRMFESPFNADENQPVTPGVWGFRLEPSSVERVVIGVRASEETKRRIVSVLKHPDFQHVHLIEAYLDDEEFQIKHRLVERDKS